LDPATTTMETGWLALVILCHQRLVDIGYLGDPTEPLFRRHAKRVHIGACDLADPEGYGTERRTAVRYRKIAFILELLRIDMRKDPARGEFTERTIQPRVDQGFILGGKRLTSRLHAEVFAYRVDEISASFQG
jgi:hypothetical protein